jgi:DNA topoisomerase I
VNAYLREAAGRDVTAKTFRTWAATVLACRLLAEADPPAAPTRCSRRAIRGAVEAVASRLGNTPTVARSAYIHPAVPEAYERGALKRPLEPAPPPPGPAWTAADEASTLELLRQWAQEQAGRRMQRSS